MIEKCDLFQIKRDLESCVGEKIQLRANRGRRRAFVKEGVLENTYPSIFVVKFQNDYESTRRVTYSYTDVLTNAVEVVLSSEENDLNVS